MSFFNIMNTTIDTSSGSVIPIFNRALTATGAGIAHILKALPSPLAEAITGEKRATSHSSPTMGDFVAVSTQSVLSPRVAAPGMSPFTENGVQMSVHDEATGLDGAAWKDRYNHIILSFMATNPLQSRQFFNAEVAADEAIFTGHTTKSEEQAAGFARSVISAAASQGIDASNIFTTGTSLGGTLAEYVSQQTGLGGVGIVSTGIKSSPAAGSGSNFINVVGYGDPWSEHDAKLNDEPGISTTAPDGAPITHYGNVWLVGSPASGLKLRAITQAFVKGDSQSPDVTLDYVSDFLNPVSALYGDLNGLSSIKSGLAGLGGLGMFLVNHLATWELPMIGNSQTIDQTIAGHGLST